MIPIYLDNNATTRPLPQVVQAVADCLRDCWGNPSSSHHLGEEARLLLSESRARIASLAGFDPREVVLSSGGTEANTLVFREAAARRKSGDGPWRVAVSMVDHSSIQHLVEIQEVEGSHVRKLRVDPNGVVDLDHLEEELRKGLDFVSIQTANSETGVIQPVEQIARRCREFTTLFHTDAAQAIGRLRPMNLEIAPDFVTWSAHKIHGPKGIGAVAIGSSAGIVMDAEKQEGGLRPGTENVAHAAGFGIASEMRRAGLGNAIANLSSLRDRLERGVLDACDGAKVNGAGAERVCNTLNVMFPGIRGEGLVRALEIEDVLCSQTSACLRARPEPSYVLRAMGLSEDQAYASLRFSVSILNTIDEIDAAVESISKAYRRLCQSNRKLIGAS